MFRDEAISVSKASIYTGVWYETSNTHLLVHRVAVQTALQLVGIQSEPLFIKR